MNHTSKASQKGSQVLPLEQVQVGSCTGPEFRSPLQPAPCRIDATAVSDAKSEAFIAVAAEKDAADPCHLGSRASASQALAIPRTSIVTFSERLAAPRALKAVPQRQVETEKLSKSHHQDVEARATWPQGQDVKKSHLP